MFSGLRVSVFAGEEDTFFPVQSKKEIIKSFVPEFAFYLIGFFDPFVLVEIILVIEDVDVNILQLFCIVFWYVIQRQRSLDSLSA